MAFNELMKPKTKEILMIASRISLRSTFLELTNGKQKENNILSQNLTSANQSTGMITFSNSPVNEIVKQASEVKQIKQKKKKVRKQKHVKKTNKKFVPENEMMKTLKMKRKLRAEQRMKREMIVSAIKRFWRLRNHLERNPPKKKSKERPETKQKMKSRNTMEQGTEKEGKNKLEGDNPEVCHDLGIVDEQKPPDVRLRPQLQIVRSSQKLGRNRRLETIFTLNLIENSIINEIIIKEITAKKRKATDTLVENRGKREMKLRKNMDIKKFQQEKKGMCIQDIYQCHITNLFHVYDKNNFLVLQEEKQETLIFFKE